MIPESAEQYYQEVGRAARDGFGANAYLLYSNKNIEVKRKHFIDRSFPTEEKLIEVYKNVGKRKGYRVLPYFDNEDIQECLPYYLESGLINVVCKGFSGLKELKNIKDPEIKQYYESTKGKTYIKTCEKNGITPEILSSKVYEALVAGNIELVKPLERWLVIEVTDTQISEQQMTIMLNDIESKRKYKHELLDYFVYLIEDNPNTQYLHQEIARYLGMDKYQLNRIYTTADGNKVRSKSEVIICNLLKDAGIKYKYEELLEYDQGKVINPDFTIYLPSGKKLFWEHIGMLGNEDYDMNWLKKLEVYNRLYPGQLIKTYESGALTLDVQKKIEEIKKLNSLGD
jgi:ATP-dependent DNA helicase RecQ